MLNVKHVASGRPGIQTHNINLIGITKHTVLIICSILFWNDVEN